MFARYVLLMSGSLGDVNMHGRNLRRKPKWDFIPRYPGKLYSDQHLRHSTPKKVHSVLLSRVYLLDQVSPRTLFSCKYLSSFLAIARALLSYSNWEQLFAKVWLPLHLLKTQLLSLSFNHRFLASLPLSFPASPSFPCPLVPVWQVNIIKLLDR